MKKLIAVAVIAATIVSITTSHAAPGLRNQNTSIPTVAILDTGIDTSLPIFSGKIIHEVCILEHASCPNNTTFMEGPGSAVLPANFLAMKEWTHGTQMASAAILANPNMQVVYIRIIGTSVNGNRQLTADATVANALKWVNDNQSRFNIQAVTMAQSHHNLGPSLNDYCPTKNLVAPVISSLNAKNVAVFFPAGNNGDLNRISWPACIQESIAVGATDTLKAIASYSNYDKNLLDFYSVGQVKVMLPGGKTTWAAGTSVAIQTAAANWIAVKSAKPSLSYTQLYDLFKATASPTKNSKISSTSLMNLAGALNG